MHWYYLSPNVKLKVKKMNLELACHSFMNKRILTYSMMLKAQAFGTLEIAWSIQYLLLLKESILGRVIALQYCNMLILSSLK